MAKIIYDHNDIQFYEGIFKPGRQYNKRYLEKFHFVSILSESSGVCRYKDLYYFFGKVKQYKLSLDNEKYRLVATILRDRDIFNLKDTQGLEKKVRESGKVYAH